MELKYFVIKEVQKRKVSKEHISTDIMIIDPLIKELSLKLFVGHVKNMGNMSTSEC